MRLPKTETKSLKKQFYKHPATFLVMENSNETHEKEKERLRMKISVLEESVKSCEVECKASRETVLRLLSELDRERRRTASSSAALDSLKQELDGLAVGRRSLEMEKGTLVERVEAGRRVMEATRRESQCLEKQVDELERKLHSSRAETQAAEEKFQEFLKNVAGLLQRGTDGVVPPTEREVLLRLDNVCNKLISEVEARLCCVSEELSEQKELQQGALQRAQLAEQQVQNLRDRLQTLETQMMAADVHHDATRHSNQQYEEFLEQLLDTMKVDFIAVDLGFDMRLKLILSRAEQLFKHETADLVKSKSLSYSLQQKLKSQKDQMESKGLHIQLLRKKVSELELEKRSRSVLSVERDDAHLEVRRLLKKMERLQNELKATKLQNTELKAQLSHTNELKLQVLKQSKSMQETRKRLDQLQDAKADLEKNLNMMSTNLQSQEKLNKEEQLQVEALRQSLDQLSERERELEDFRMVVSQMLGVDSTNLALTNYEIIKLLETLIHSHHHHHHLHHHVNAPCYCPTHQRPHPLKSPDRHGSTSGALFAVRNSFPGDAVPL